MRGSQYLFAVQLALCLCWQHCHFVQHYYAYFLSYNFCTGLMMLGQFHHQCLAINPGCLTFCSAMFIDFCDQKVHQEPQLIKWKVTDGEGVECPSMTTNQDNIECAIDMVLLDGQGTVDVTANHLHISHGSACKINCNRLWFHKVCTGWVPKQLTVLHKQICFDICQ